MNADGTATIRSAASGMTIGYGVDLGQMNAAQLSSYLTAQGTISWPKGAINGPYDALSPYLGVRNGVTIAGIEATHGGAPVISAMAAAAISTGALNYQMGRAANDYTSATADAGLGEDANFYGLSAASQTVLTDITYVFGSIYSTNAAIPDGLVDAIGTQNWSQVASLLLNAPTSSYSSRLKNDGTMLKAAITAGKTPAKGTACK